jgi:DNA polymerase-4
LALCLKAITRRKLMLLSVKLGNLLLGTSLRELILDNVKDLLFQSSLKDSVRLLEISISNLNNETKKKEDSSKEESIDVQLKLEF